MEKITIYTRNSQINGPFAIAIPFAMFQKDRIICGCGSGSGHKNWGMAGMA